MTGQSARFFVLILLGLAFQPAFAVDVAVVYYDVHGKTLEELRRGLGENGPLQDGRRYHAHTRWNVTWTYRGAPRGAGCEFAWFNVAVDGVMTLPRWTPPSDAPRELIERWANYETALRMHEAGHFEHGLRAAREIEELGKSFLTTTDCRAIDSEFHPRAMQVIQTYNERDMAYDRDTGHGASQGAEL
jgi:predicted secreted Zn-dependent protease